uniref:Uncharacterized protein n=1 Tax=Glossina austeni TaxID=7395 RepID=A0A1A9VUB5_GLOAU
MFCTLQRTFKLRTKVNRRTMRVQYGQCNKRSERWTRRQAKGKASSTVQMHKRRQWLSRVCYACHFYFYRATSINISIIGIIGAIYAHDKAVGVQDAYRDECINAGFARKPSVAQDRTKLVKDKESLSPGLNFYTTPNIRLKHLIDVS